MRRFCIWLLERLLPDDLVDHVVGDLLEQPHHGRRWLLAQTIAALVQLRCRPTAGDGIMSTFISDMRLAVRYLRRAPAFAITAIVTLGLEIGATTEIFSVIDPVLLRPLPYPDPNRVTFVGERDRNGGRDNIGFITAQELGAQSTSIERWAVTGSWEPTLGDSDAERVSGSRVSWTYFRTLGVQPALGRDFRADEDQPDQNRVVILSDRLWKRRFGGDASIVGRNISVAGTPYLVAGVMPASFDDVAAPASEIWRVLGYSPTQPWACRTCHHLRMIARLKPTVTIEQATTELSGFHARMVKEHPTQYASIGMWVAGLQDEVTRDYRAALMALGGAVVLVLLIAVANVVNLQLARAVRRRDELAIRVALGAGRGRITRQMLAEGLVLASLGGSAGLAVAWTALPVLIAQLPPALPRLGAIHINLTSLGLIASAVLGLAIVMALITGGRHDASLSDSLRSSKRLAGGAHHLTRSTLVVAEVALAVMLLVSAGLVAKSLVKLLSVDAGFDATNLLTMEVDAVGPRYADNASVFAFHDRVRDAVRALPGVVGVGITNQIPLGGNVDMYGLINVEHPPMKPELMPSGDRYVVSPDYLSTMRIPILKGRAFTAAENRDSVPLVALVSAALAQKMWPGEDPIGKHFKVGGRSPREVIGVTGNVKHRSLDAARTLQWYIPERQWQEADNSVMLLVRTSVDPATLSAPVRHAIASIDATQPVIKIATMDHVIAVSTAQRRLALVLFGAFAIAALLLAVAGIYGVLAGNVAERTREIGLRSALGATPRAIMALVLRQGGVLAAVGIVLGMLGAVGLTRYLKTFLFAVEPTDASTLAAVVVVLSLVALGACAIPARRAVRIDPSEALREN